MPKGDVSRETSPFKNYRSITIIFWENLFSSPVLQTIEQTENLVKKIDGTNRRKKGGENMKNLPSNLQKEPSYLSEKSQQLI